MPSFEFTKVRPVPEVMDVPSKKVTPFVVCAVALVPPPAIVSVPESVGAKVKVVPALVIFNPCVCPLVVTEVVAKVIAPV